NGAISKIFTERTANTITVTMHTAKPGIVIGRGGRGVDMLRAQLEEMTGKKVQVNVQEIKRPELDAQLVAENIASQIERRISFRRAMKQALQRTMKMGAQGMKVRCAGRLGGAEIAHAESYKSPEGRIPLHTLRADVDYGLAEARTQYGYIGVKVWIYKGDILPETKPKDKKGVEGPQQEGTLANVDAQAGEVSQATAGAPAGDGDAGQQD
ncbi:MAG: 30S ribosomal protein S3, partial [Armatimonadota bacterium]